MTIQTLLPELDNVTGAYKEKLSKRPQESKLKSQCLSIQDAILRALYITGFFHRGFRRISDLSVLTEF